MDFLVVAELDGQIRISGLIEPRVETDYALEPGIHDWRCWEGELTRWR